ncbi:MAG TPA: hypothetical protein VF618_04695 [Thermoanaerobaculia bacterium]
MAALWIEVIGLAGASSLLLAYLLVSSGRVTSGSSGYQLLNLIGALGFVINGWVHRAYPTVILGVIWFLVAVVFLSKRKAVAE